MRRAAVWLIVLLGLAAVGAAGESSDRAYVDGVVDGLVKAGVLTADQAAQIKADAQRAAEAAPEAEPASKPKWTDTIRFSGYGQMRWQYYPDAAAGDADNEFLVRRARMKLFAEPADRTRAQLMIDLGEGELEVNDAWLEYDLDAAGEWTVRAGQQQVPFGFESPQSASKIVPLERNWVVRRMIPGTRDTGVTLFWTDPDDQKLFEHSKQNELGAGDYGTVAIGLYNGQGINAAETNSGKHVMLRYAKPWMVGEQYVEAGASYVTGEYTSDAARMDLDDDLFALHLYVPPRPVGFQGEYYSGETEGADLDGFYAMGLWRPRADGIAFVRHDEYNGARKGKGLGNVYDRERWSLGYEHTINSKSKLTVEYDIQDTATGDDDLFGVQWQVGY